MPFEVEMKFRVADPSQVRHRLERLGARRIGVKDQTDQYFNHPARDFAHTDEALRIRSVGSENFVTYKGPKLDATTKTRREIETPIGPGAESWQQFAELLLALGFRAVRAVAKQREVFMLDGNELKPAVEIAVDHVDRLGWFVELESSAGETDVPRVRDALVRLADRLGLVESERRSYLELLLEVAP